MSDVQFAQTSPLDLVVPEDSNLDIEESLSSISESGIEEDENSSFLSSIQQRGILYFGTFLRQFIVK